MNSQATASRNRSILGRAALLMVALLSAVTLALFLVNRSTPVPASWGTAEGLRNGFSALINLLLLGIVMPLVTTTLGACDCQPAAAQSRWLAAGRAGRLLLVDRSVWRAHGYHESHRPAGLGGRPAGGMGQQLDLGSELFTAVVDAGSLSQRSFSLQALGCRHRASPDRLHGCPVGCCSVGANDVLCLSGTEPVRGHAPGGAVRHPLRDRRSQ